MGMFDTIKNKLFCPYCSKLNDEFQTKDLGNFCSEWTIEQIKEHTDYFDETNIYTKCKSCNEWIQLVIRGEKKNDT